MIRSRTDVRGLRHTLRMPSREHAVGTGARHLWGCQEKTTCCSTWEDASAARAGRGRSNPWRKPAQNTRSGQVGENVRRYGNTRRVVVWVEPRRSQLHNHREIMNSHCFRAGWKYYNQRTGLKNQSLPGCA